MPGSGASAFRLSVIIAHGFNLNATVGFLDPFRAANYLAGRNLYQWSLLSATGGEIASSSGLSLVTEPVDSGGAVPDIGVISTSWTPERHAQNPVGSCLRRWARFGATLAGIDTGGIVLADCGLLDGYRATVHYEHLDALGELFPAVESSENLYVIDRDRLTCSGGTASTDLALALVMRHHGAVLADAAARYVFHPSVRDETARQNPSVIEPLGRAAPRALRDALVLMERHLEEPLRIPEIAVRLDMSQRKLERLFERHVGKSPMLYYRDIRLDRARALVTQTDLAVHEVALACGFSSAVHFSRAYRARFSVPPSEDRSAGRVPFEFRAWPMYKGAADT